MLQLVSSVRGKMAGRIRQLLLLSMLLVDKQAKPGKKVSFKAIYI